jgi:hypothetical protein
MNKILIIICILIFGLVLVFLTACSNKKNLLKNTTPLTKEEKIRQFGQNLFKKDFVLDYNRKKTVVCISKSIKNRPNNPYSTFSFVLYHIELEEVIFRETIPKASGKWLNNEEFQVTTIPGRISNRINSAKKGKIIYNISTRKITKNI